VTSAPITPPVEATLRILMNSVPFLMGAAVVRQPPGSDGVVASVGRMPWLHDRRLTTLQLPDDTLPSNRAVALDWPVPFQAEWVGAPPRLLISRLVFHGRTVGVLLGTLVSREPMSQQTREALDLSGELIASAVAGESAYARSVPPPASEVERAAPPSIFAPAPARPTPSDLVVEEVRKGLESAVDARSLGRVLRDAMSQITEASAFSVALFHLSRAEVAYRYKVVGPDRDSAELGRQHVDDGPACYAARHDRRWHVFAREVAIRDETDARVREVIVLQIPLATGGEVYGIVTVQTFRPEGYTDQELRLIATIVEASSTHFALARAAGRYQPAAAPAPAAPSTPSDLRVHTAGTAPVNVAQVTAAAPAVATAPVNAVSAVSSPVSAPPEPLITPPTPMNTASGNDIPAAPTARAGRNAEDVLRDLLRRCAGAGFPTAFLLGVHSGAGSLKGEMVSEGEAARELDYALGISSGKFAIPLDDRYNAIARAVREGRIVPAPTLYEITRPLTDFEGAQTIERLAKGGRSVTLPLVVSGTPAGALVLGPMAEDPTFFAIEAVRGYVADAAKELQTLWA
jgi:GAF domain-containing protein